MDHVVIDQFQEPDPKAVLDDLAASVPGALFQYVLLPDGTDRIRFMSAGCTDIWGLSADEIQGDPTKLWAQVHPEDRPAMIESVHRSAEQGAPWSHEYRIIAADGRLKWLRGNGQPRTHADGAVVWNTIILDITAEVEGRRQIKDQRQRHDQLEKKFAEDLRRRSASEIVSSIAHEINQPLAAAVNYTYAAKMKSNALSDDGQISALIERAEAEIHRTSQIVSRIRGLYKAEEIRRTEADIKDLVDEAVATFQNDQAFDLPIGVFHGHLERPVPVDRIQIQQVISNLLRNAMDASIMATNPVVKVTTMQSRDHTVITVEDNGRGVAPERRREIFEPFETDKARGLGVGLALCATIIRAHQGKIECLGAPSGGALFKVTLPNAS